MAVCTILRLWKLLFIGGILLQESTHGNRRMHASGGLTSVLVLDIDGTVYDDDCLIESQIRDNCHIFSGTFGYSVADSEDMHVKFGSTIRGICEYGQPRIKFLDYYNDVYPHLDMSLLRKYSGIKASGNTGYNVEMGDALQSLHHLDCPIVVASNSPVFHVKRVLARLGLTKLKVDAFITPERRKGFTKNEAEFWDPLFELYPPNEYLCTLIDDNGLNVELVRKLGMRALRITPQLSLSEALVHYFNLLPPHHSEPAVLENDFKSRPSPTSAEGFVFSEISYLDAKNEIDSRSYNPPQQCEVVRQLTTRIKHRQRRNKGASKIPLVAVDLGAGLLNMLHNVQRMMSEACEETDSHELLYVAFESNKNIQNRTIEMLLNSGFESVPSSVDLNSQTASTLRAGVKSFRGQMSSKSESKSKHKRGGVAAAPMTVTVHLVMEDFMTDAALKILNDVLSSHRSEGGDLSKAPHTTYTPPRPLVDLIVGCCVADLVPPRALAAQVLEMAGDGGGILYLPITFCGATTLIREGTDERRVPDPSPKMSLHGEGALRIPTDKEVFEVYHKHLEAMGHHLDGPKLISTLEDYGCEILTPPGRPTAASNWLISKRNSPYMWRCMMRFIALGTAFETLGRFDLKSWFDRVNGDESGQSDSVIEVENIDILAVLPEIVQRILPPRNASTVSADVTDDDALLCTEFSAPPAEALRRTPSDALRSTPSRSTAPSGVASHPLEIPTRRRYVEFVSPGVVHVSEEDVLPLSPNQLLLATSCSLISTGTELKVFNGDLDSDQPADLTISGMQDKMSYPLRYGYSLVGRVIAVGADLREDDWVGKTVFSFSPHASSVVIDASSAMLVPEGISPEDAVFLPSVETAVSLVQVAGSIIGEKVLVVGQGLIGMLTGAVLSELAHADTTIADICEKRLTAASTFNSKALQWNPSTHPPFSDAAFDITIEVSGHPGGLQTAIDNTGQNGRVVVGSWYGEAASPLKLGLKFHRSGLRIICSQVSTIPSELTGRWDKDRRFELTWKAIKLIRPSRLISSVAALRTEDVLAAYLRLKKGEDVTVLFRDE